MNDYSIRGFLSEYLLTDKAKRVVSEITDSDEQKVISELEHVQTGEVWPYAFLLRCHSTTAAEEVLKKLGIDDLFKVVETKSFSPPYVGLIADRFASKALQERTGSS